MRAFVLSMPMLIAVSAAAPAQTVAPASVTVLAPLPSPNLSADAKPSEALRAAQGALAAGRTREAQDALEMAEQKPHGWTDFRGPAGPRGERPPGLHAAYRDRACVRDRAGIVTAIAR